MPAALTAATGSVFLLLASLVPLPLVLPAFSLVSICVAGVAAFFAWWAAAERHTASLTPWDISGAFALIGCAAAILARPENVAQLFDRLTMAQ
jgi:hypothetical protein